MLKRGTIVDAAIIAAPSSTKNSTGTRDPEQHQAKKGNQWNLGMKAHAGSDAESGLVHTVVGAAANTTDVTVAYELLTGEEDEISGDAGYQGVEKRPENADTPVRWHVAMRPGKRKALGESPVHRILDQIERCKASMPSGW